MRVVHLTSDRNVIVSEFSTLGLVDTNDFGFVGSTELESRDVIDDEEEDVGDDGDVSHDRSSHGKFPSELDPVAAKSEAKKGGKGKKKGKEGRKSA